MERDFKGVWIPKEIWLDERLGALDKIILTEINSLDTGEGCFAGNKYLAEFCQCSESKVSKSVALLTELGYLKVVKFDGRIRFLKVCLVKNARQNSKKCQADWQKMPAINIDNNIVINNKEGKKVTFEDIFNEKNVSTELKKAFIDLLQSRALNKKKMTNRALELAIDKVRKLESSEDRQIKVIEQSIENGWQGLFPLKDFDEKDKTEILYIPKEGEDVTYKRLFDFWKKVLHFAPIEDVKNVNAAKSLLEIDGEENCQRLIIALKMRSEHGYLPKEIKNIADFDDLLTHRASIWAFYNKHYKEWANWAEREREGKKKWQI